MNSLFIYVSLGLPLASVIKQVSRLKSSNRVGAESERALSATENATAHAASSQKTSDAIRLSF